MIQQNIQVDDQGHLRHLLTIEGLKRQKIIDILDAAESFTTTTGQPVKKAPILRGKTIVNLFFEPSTRTLTTFELAAKACGLGTCWAGLLMMAVADNFKPVIEALNLPEGNRCFGGMMLGYPLLKYQRIPARKKPLVIFND